MATGTNSLCTLALTHSSVGRTLACYEGDMKHWGTLKDCVRSFSDCPT